NDTRSSGDGSCKGIDRPNLVIPAKAGIRATRTEPAALDTGFRRYDGACCLVGDCQIPLSTYGRVHAPPPGALKVARRPPHQGEGWSVLLRSGRTSRSRHPGESRDPGAT